MQDSAARALGEMAAAEYGAAPAQSWGSEPVALLRLMRPARWEMKRLEYVPGSPKPQYSTGTPLSEPELQKRGAQRLHGDDEPRRGE